MNFPVFLPDSISHQSSACTSAHPFKMICSATSGTFLPVGWTSSWFTKDVTVFGPFGGYSFVSFYVLCVYGFALQLSV